MNFQLKPSPGSSFRYAVTSKYSSYDRLFKQRSGSLSERVINITYDNFLVGNEKYNFKITIDSVNTYFSEGKSDITKDESNHVTPDVETLSVLKDQPFYIIVAGNGSIEKISGYEEFKKKVDDIYQKSSTATKKAAPTSRAYTKAYFLNLFSDVLSNIPQTNMAQPQTWQKEESYSNTYPIKYLSTYSVDKIDSNVIKLSGHANISQEYEINKQPVNAKGESESQVTIDYKDGMLRSKKTITKITSETKAGKITFVFDTIDEKEIVRLN